MVNASKKNLLPLPAGKYGKSTEYSTPRPNQANNGKSGFEVERVGELGALRSIRSAKKLSVEKRLDTHFLINKEKAKWIEDYEDRDTAAARKRVQDAETAIMQEKEDMRNVERRDQQPQSLKKQLRRC